MRETLREPVVFSEMVELPQLFTHPHLYLPFAGPGLVIGGALAALCGGRWRLLVFEPPVWEPRPLAALAAAGADAAGMWLGSRERPVGVAARRAAPDRAAERRAVRRRRRARAVCDAARAYRHCAGRARHGGGVRGPGRTRTPPSGLRTRRCAQPANGGVRRAADQGGTLGKPAPSRSSSCSANRSFDARRLSPAIPPELLAGFAACCASSAQFGRLVVPGWGANTMRAEFAVLTGIPESELGYDRFNPYYALARTPIDSHVWRLRRAGYRTICLHPFDRRFFRRDLAMPALGFERFLGRETLGGSRTPPYYPDPDLARDILRILDREGPRDLPLRDHDGQSRPLADEGAADRPRYRRPVRSRRGAGRRRAVALSRRAATLRRDAADPDRRVGAARQTGRARRSTAIICRACRTPSRISASPRHRPTM